MTHMVEHRPLFEELPERYRTLSPDWRVQSDGAPGLAPFSVRCYHESTATRVAQALDLLDAKDAIKPGDAMKIDDNGGFLHRHLDGRYHWLSEKEIMQRAREAAIKYTANGPCPELRAESIRNNAWDDSGAVQIACIALRDLSKPLADLVPPPVDPDLIEARKIVVAMLAPPTGPLPWCFTYQDGSLSEDMGVETARKRVEAGDFDRTREVQAALAAIKLGRELAGG